MSNDASEEDGTGRFEPIETLFAWSCRKFNDEHGSVTLKLTHCIEGDAPAGTSIWIDLDGKTKDGEDWESEITLSIEEAKQMLSFLKTVLND